MGSFFKKRKSSRGTLQLILETEGFLNQIGSQVLLFGAESKFLTDLVVFFVYTSIFGQLPILKMLLHSMFAIKSFNPQKNMEIFKPWGLTQLENSSHFEPLGHLNLHPIARNLYISSWDCKL